MTFRARFMACVGVSNSQTSTHLVRALWSDRWDAESIETLEELGEGQYHTLDAGHWLHVDNPEGLLKMLVSLCCLHNEMNVRYSSRLHQNPIQSDTDRSGCSQQRPRSKRAYA